MDSEITFYKIDDYLTDENAWSLEDESFTYDHFLYQTKLCFNRRYCFKVFRMRMGPILKKSNAVFWRYKPEINKTKFGYQIKCRFSVQI